MSTAPVKWGVIGAGGFADKRFLPQLAGAPSAELHAVMVRDRQRAEEIAGRHGAARAYDSVEGLLADGEVQAVYVCTPVQHHCEHVLAAARAGKHVLCEKPMARTEVECERMIRACEAAGVKLMMAFMNRFRPAHRRIREMIVAGELGQIIMVRTQQSSYYQRAEGSWRQDPRLGGGGALYDIGSHALDLLCYLGGPVARVSALVDTRVQDYEVDDVATALLELESGAHGIMFTSFCVKGRANPVEVFGTERSVLCRRTAGPYEQGEVIVAEPDGSEQRLEGFAPSFGYVEEIEHLSRCIIKGTDPEVTGHDGLHNVAIMRAMQQSARTGRTIRL
ncbi:MAG TPA: Gfo/Idh/MocA family oxidoreductase [Armatimonadota bacterium]|nr:Gfo/Idh/MocA family oxidoreductase [Armatimonadota bacterium]